MPASGHQDHTTSPSASSAIRQERVHVHRIPPRVRDDREPPLQWDGTGRICRDDLPDGHSEKFLRFALDRNLPEDPEDEVICPTGKSGAAARNDGNSA